MDINYGNKNWTKTDLEFREKTKLGQNDITGR
jgi:hypothetical protein